LPQRLAERVAFVLAAATGRTCVAEARRLGVDAQRPRRWRKRWHAAQPRLAEAEAKEVSDDELETLVLEVLSDGERSGAPAKFSAEQISLIITRSSSTSTTCWPGHPDGRTGAARSQREVRSARFCGMTSGGNGVDSGAPLLHMRCMKGDDIAARLVAFGASVVALVAALPQDRGGKHIADQLLRSATSGGSNYEEAQSAQSRMDFVHKVSLAAKEMRESVYWLGLVDRAKLAPQHDIPPLLREAGELVAILMSSAKTAGARNAG
jgi:four helix bundle protein